MEYWLVCAPAGCGLKGAIDRLLSSLGSDLGTAAVDHEDVEDVLCDLAETRELLAEIGVPLYGPPTMFEVSYNLQREQVIRLWQQALDQALTSLRNGSGQLKLLSCHFTLYGGRRREFYIPLRISSLSSREAVPTRLLLLIDDVLDMYARLTQPNYLYDEDKLSNDYIRGIQTEERVTTAQLEGIRPQLILEWKVSTLTALLAWRHADMLIAESVARQTRSKYLAFGVKNLLTVAKSWLLNHEPASAYLSHPITRPRTQLSDDGVWPDVVNQFNELQKAFQGREVYCVMPTAIDEFRFRRHPHDPISQLEPTLGPRWPIPTESDYEDTLYLPPPGGPELENLIDPGGVATFNPDPWLRSFESQVKLEIAFRDHHLVANCAHLFVFRPLYDEGKFSRGVFAEIDHWNLLASENSGSHRRAVFIHFSADVGRMIELEGEDIVRRTFNNTERIWQERGWSPGNARRIREVVESGGALSSSSLLDAGFVSPPQQNQIESEWPEVRMGARIAALREKLTGVALPESQLGIWVLGGADEMRASYDEIAQFTKGESPPPTSWEETAEALLP